MVHACANILYLLNDNNIKTFLHSQATGISTTESSADFNSKILNIVIWAYVKILATTVMQNANSHLKVKHKKTWALRITTNLNFKNMQRGTEVWLQYDKQDSAFSFNNTNAVQNKLKTLYQLITQL